MLSQKHGHADTYTCTKMHIKNKQRITETYKHAHIQAHTFTSSQPYKTAYT